MKLFIIYFDITFPILLNKSFQIFIYFLYIENNIYLNWYFTDIHKPMYKYILLKIGTYSNKC